MIKRKAVIVDWDKPILRLYHIADAHIGSLQAREDKAAKLAEIIAADECARVLGGGDYTESIAPSDRRWDIRELAQPVMPENVGNLFYCQALRFAKIFEPTVGKWDGLVMGNHGHTATTRYFTNTVAIIADRLGTRYVGGTEQCGWFLYRLRQNGKVRGVLRVFVIHGWGGGELRGADALKMQRLLWRKGADVLLMGHVHRPMVFPETVETLGNRGYERTEQRWGIIGYPLVGKHGYLARKGGNECPVGYTVVEVERQHDDPPLISVSQRML